MKLAPARSAVSASTKIQRACRTVLERLEDRTLFAAVATDLADYSFGQTAAISGVEFQPFEVVQLQVQHQAGTVGSNDDPQNQPWQVQADAAGSFTTSWLVNDPDARDATYVLTATGLSSGDTASTVFTDGTPRITGVSEALISPSNADGTKDSSTITVRNNGTGTTTGITVRIRSGTSIGGTLVREITVGSVAGNTNTTVAWDGKDTNGNYVADGTYTVRAFDPTNGENNTFTATIVVDNTPPASPAITGITSDTGTLDTDGVTNDRTLIIAGTAAPGAVVTIRRDGNVIGTDTANGSGAWSLDYRGTTLNEGTYSFTATTVDPAGNTSAASTAFVVKVDLTAPAVAIATVTGPINLANRGNLSASGNGEAGASISVVARDTGNGATTAVNTTVDTNGNWSVSGIDATGLADGTITYSATATDAAGNPSSPVTMTATKDTVVPAVTSIVRAGANPSKAGSVDFTVTFNTAVSGVDVGDFSLTTSGISGAQVTGVSGGSTVYTVTVNTGSGDGSLQLNFVDNDSVTDTAGNPTAAGLNGASYTIDKTLPTVAAPDLTAGTDLGAFADDNITADNTPTFTGTTESGATVSVYADGTLLGTAVANGGTWTYTVPTLSALADGDHDITVIAVDTAGNTSAESAALTVTIDTVDPTVTVDTPVVVTQGQTSTITGTAVDTGPGGVAVEVRRLSNDSLLSSGSATNTGTDFSTWSFSYTAISGGNQYVTASVTDLAGNSAQATANFFVNQAPTATVDLSATSPLTNDTLAATATTADSNGDAVTLTYVWKVNGTVVKTTSNTSSLTDTLDLSVAGNGNKGDSITVEVTPNDGKANGALVSDSATVANTAPTATVQLSDATPGTNDTLTATATKADVDGDVISLTYVWKVNGTVVKTTANTSSLTDTLDLSLTGNGNGGDTITVEVTPNDGTANGTLVSDSGVVTNTAPTATAQLSDSAPKTNDTLTATATAADADGDAVSLTYVWKVNGTVVKTTSNTTSLTDTLDLSVAGNGDKGDSITVEVTPNDGIVDGTLVDDSAVVANSAPTATVQLSDAAPKTNDTLTATATSGDADGDVVSLTYVWKVNGTVVKTTSNTTSLTDTLDLSLAGNGSKGDTITVEVTPNDGTANGSADSDTATVANSTPTLTLGGSSGSETDNLTQNFSWSAADVDLDIASVAVTITRAGQTVYSNAGAANVDSYNFDSLGLGAYQISVTVTDTSGATASDTRSVTVSDDDTTAPTIALGGSSGAQSTGQTQVFTWSVSDASGVGSTLVVVTRNGTQIYSGSAASGSFNFDSYGVGNYTITVNATDGDNDWTGDGSSGSNSQSVTVTTTLVLPGVPGLNGGTDLVIHGSDQNDSIQVDKSGTPGQLILTINGATQTVAASTGGGRVVVYGYNGNDTILIAGAVLNQAWIYGDNGADTLNLGNGGGIAFGGNGNDNLLGGGGADILVGGDGADKLVGNAGDDILVSASTLYDDRFSNASHEAAWSNILKDWSRTDISFATRVSYAEVGGQGALSAYRLNASMLIDDGDTDTVDMLNGGAGNDWFLYKAGQDKVTGLSATEAAYDVTA